MTQTTLLVVLAAILTGGILLYNTQRHAADADERLEQQQYKGLARDAAEVGLNVVVRALADSYTLGSWTDGGFDIAATDYYGGTFTADVQQFAASGDTVDVIVRGYHRAGRSTIFARYARDEDDVGIPPAFRNVITTQLDIDLRGKLLVDAISEDWNASVHTNTVLELSGNGFLVEGYGTYWNGGEPIDFGNAPGLDNFLPNIDYNGDDPNVFQSDDEIEIPLIDPDGLSDAAEESGGFLNVSTTISNALIDFTDPSAAFWASYDIDYNCDAPPCGSPENPFVLYINGATTFSDVVVVGHGIIFVDADIALTGDMYGTISASSETQVLLATTHNITAPNNTCFGLGPSEYQGPNPGDTWNNSQCESADGVSYSHGLSMYAQENITFSGTPFIVGGLVSPNADFLGSGNPWIAYAAPSETIVDPGFEYIVPIGPVLISYSEW